ncbi:MAG: helix-turn-helix domain-containing protein [Bacteroidetes bacterium]|nr:helix-turn-helix domain-containing protein [Bacteroidota bacterium]
MIPEEFKAVDFCNLQIELVKKQQEIAEKFVLELDSLFNEMAFNQEKNKIRMRLQKAVRYFTIQVYDELIAPFETFKSQFDGVARIKKYLSLLEDTENAFWQKVIQLQEASFAGDKLLESPIVYRSTSHEPKLKTKKKEKGDSAKETFAYFSSGKTIEEITRIRHLATSTIESHLAEFVRSGELDVFQFVSYQDIQDVKEMFEQTKSFSSTTLVQKLQNRLTHSQVKMALNYLLFKGEIEMKPVPSM